MCQRLPTNDASISIAGASVSHNLRALPHSLPPRLLLLLLMLLLLLQLQLLPQLLLSLLLLLLFVLLLATLPPGLPSRGRHLSGGSRIRCGPRRQRVFTVARPTEAGTAGAADAWLLSAGNRQRWATINTFA